MAKGYKVCWWYPAKVDVKYYSRPRKPTCRVLSAEQHRSAREAAETVLMQNSGAYVRVVSPQGGGRGTVFKVRGGRYTGIASVVKTNLGGLWPFTKKKPKVHPMTKRIYVIRTPSGRLVPADPVTMRMRGAERHRRRRRR